MNLNLRNILTIIGLTFLAVGPVLMHHVDSATVYLFGEIMIALGPVLIGYRAITKDDPSASPPTSYQDFRADRTAVVSGGSYVPNPNAIPPYAPTPANRVDKAGCAPWEVMLYVWGACVIALCVATFVAA